MKPWTMENDHPADELKSARRPPWNKGKLIGAKPPFRPSQVSSIRASEIAEKIDI